MLRLVINVYPLNKIIMCGILVFGVTETPEEKVLYSSSNTLQNLFQLVKNRGPDAYSEGFSNFPCWKIQFSGSVLWMQGKDPVSQPIEDKQGNMLLWNGDIFDGPMMSSENECDTAIVFRNVFQNKSVEKILDTLSTIKGPYSFVYWNKRSSKLWFGRDRIGRHSLLYYLNKEEFILASVGIRDIPFSEVPVYGVFVMDFSKDSYSLTMFPWSDAVINDVSNIDARYPISVANLVITSPVLTKCPEPFEPAENYMRLVRELHGDTNDIFEKLLLNSMIAPVVDKVLKCLRKAVKVRSNTQCKMCRECILSVVSSESSTLMNDQKCTHPQVGILFSGGVDSTTIAALAHECIPTNIPIDLFNVAFETASKDKNSRQQCPKYNKFLVPDRITGIQSHEELKEKFPNRQWNFIQIDIAKTELDELRRTKISDLIHPLESVLDDSLGCALWFASRLKGLLDSKQYVSPVRILLLGMGADEQFGGYLRHRTILRHQGWAALSAEIDVELQRIALRNLGRDDRIVSDHGCQARFPFLDEDVVNCVGSLPVWMRCHPTSGLRPGVGDKLLLRLVAWKLGLKKASFIPKRAFQFGSRIANSKEKASDVSIRLKS